MIYHNIDQTLLAASLQERFVCFYSIDNTESVKFNDVYRTGDTESLGFNDAYSDHW